MNENLFVQSNDKLEFIGKNNETARNLNEKDINTIQIIKSSSSVNDIQSIGTNAVEETLNANNSLSNELIITNTNSDDNLINAATDKKHRLRRKVKKKCRNERDESAGNNHTLSSLPMSTELGNRQTDSALLSVDAPQLECRDSSADDPPHCTVVHADPDNARYLDSPDLVHDVKKEECSNYEKLQDELMKFLPNKKAKIMIITWNMAGISDYPENLSELIHNSDRKECDVYLLCFQETTNNKTELLYRIQSTFGVHYVVYDHIENKKLFAVLVGHKKFIWNIGIIGVDYFSTRITTITKGVAAISFYFFGSSFLFLGSHFSSDLGRNDLRMEDYQAILNCKSLRNSLTQNLKRLGFDENNLSHYFDYTFWAGDLNFRITLEDCKVRNFVHQEQQNKTSINIENLLEYDELINGQIDGIIFQEFEEGRITFLPTYKFGINTNEYNKARTPAYTDRILFRSHKGRGIDYLNYLSVDTITHSDHKPVRAIVEVDIEPNTSEYMNSSGKFNKEIYDKCFKSGELKTHQPPPLPAPPSSLPAQSRMCSIQ